MRQVLLMAVLVALMVAAMATAQESQNVVALNLHTSASIHIESVNESMEMLNRMKSEGQWTDQTKLLLAQSLWGEAGISPRYKNVNLRGSWKRVPCEFGEENSRCYENLDWKLIPWILLTRWDSVSRRRNISFGRMIQMYSAPLDPELASIEREMRMKALGHYREVAQIKRRRFIQGLEWNGEKLKGMAKNYGPGLGEDFLYHGWKALTDNVIKWGQGQIPHKCKGARHWDMTSAPVSLKLPRINCGKTLNAFYGEL